MTIRSVAVLGAGTMGAQIAAHFANAGTPALLLDVTADAARQGLERARRLKPDPFFTPDTWKLVTTGSFDPDLESHPRVRLDHRSRRRTARHQAHAAGEGRRCADAPDRSSRRTRRASRLRPSPKDAATTSGGTGSVRTSSTRRGTFTFSKSFPRPRRSATSSTSSCISPITVSAKAS